MPRVFAVLLIFLVLAPPPLRAAEVTPEQLQALARHSQALHQLYSQGLQISAAMDDGEALIESYLDGALTEPEMRQQVNAIRTEAGAAITAYQRDVAALPPPPRIGDRKRDEALAAFVAMVGGLTAKLEAQAQLLPRLVDTAVAGDARAYELAQADSLALAGAMILAENTAIEAALTSAGPRHPQRGLYHASIGSNLAMGAALILIEDSLRGAAPRSEDARGRIADGLARAERGIADGRRDAEAMLGRYAGKPAKTEEDRLGKRFIEDLVTAYGRAFDDETRIVSAMRGFLDDVLAARDAPGGAAATRLARAAATFQGEIGPLMQARLDEQATRLRMVEEFSAALAAL
ncbi:MAG: hypothetical protein JSU82_14740 [Rhodospirillales bacterium]|nr:MAG: hypothetical protein JSU82_14740 [Rhodospirillales bacterium]